MRTSPSNVPALTAHLRQEMQKRQDQLVKTAADKGTPSDPDNKGTAQVPSDEEARKKLNLQTNPDNTNGGESSTGAEGEKVGDPLPPSAEPARVGTPEKAVGEGDSVKTAGALKASLSGLRVKLASLSSGTPPQENAKTPETVVKTATAQPEAPVFGDEVLIKLARQMLQTEEGRASVELLLHSQLGAEVADGLVKQAAASAQAQRDQEAAQAEWLIKQASAIEQHQQALQAHLAALPENVRESVIKVASAIEHKMSLLPDDSRYHEMFKRGAADAAAMMAMGGGEGAPMGAMPADDAGMEAAMPPGATGELSPEELAALIQELVNSGQLPPEVAEQLLMQLMGEQESQVKTANAKLLVDEGYEDLIPGYAEIFTGVA